MQHARTRTTYPLLQYRRDDQPPARPAGWPRTHAPYVSLKLIVSGAKLVLRSQNFNDAVPDLYNLQYKFIQNFFFCVLGIRICMLLCWIGTDKLC